MQFQYFVTYSLTSKRFFIGSREKVSLPFLPVTFCRVNLKNDNINANVRKESTKENIATRETRKILQKKLCKFMMYVQAGGGR
jgi:hypothetical protein